MVPTARQLAARELLQDFHFDVSPRAQFVIAYAALELLCPARRNEPSYKAALKKLDNCLRTLPLDEELRSRLANDLKGLRQDSHAGALQREVDDHLGRTRAAEVEELRAVRNDFFHRGECPPETSIHAVSVYHIAKDLLFEQLARAAARSASGAPRAS